MPHVSGGPPETLLGRLRLEREQALLHQDRVAREWDHSLGLIRKVEFTEMGPSSDLVSLRSAVEIWHDLTIEVPRRLSSLGGVLGLPEDTAECFEYIHRVMVGHDPDGYHGLCDAMESAIDDVETSLVTIPASHIRDRLVELMEIGLGTSTRSVQWLEKHVDDLENPR